MGRNATEVDVEEIIEMASKASVPDQQKQVQENIHSQIINFCISMDEILLLDMTMKNEQHEAAAESSIAPRRSGLSFAVGKSGRPTHRPSELTVAISFINCLHFFFSRVHL